MIFIGLAGQIRDSNSYISSNILMLISALLFVGLVVQTILSFLHYNGIYCVVTSIISLLIFFFINISITIIFWIFIKKDPGFIKWSINHCITEKLMYIFSTMLSFNIYRLFYSRFLGFEWYCIRLNDYKKYWKFMNIMSIISMVWWYLVWIIGDIVALVYLSWTSQLNVMVI